MSEFPPEPPNLRFLRRLVTVLTAVMIFGIVGIFGLLLLRLSSPDTIPLPPEVTLPAGVTATAVTYGPGWYAVVTDDARILIFDQPSGELRQEVEIDSD